MRKIVRPLQTLAGPVTLVCLFILMTFVYVMDRSSYFSWLDLINEHPFHTPFIDTRFITAQVQCWSRGIDVYANNPCDPLGRLQDYSPLWLRLPFLARTDDWTITLGLTIDMFFLASLFLLPWKADTGFSLAITLCAVLSHATVYALERGNSDVLIFAVTVLFSHLLAKPLAPRALGYAFVLTAGLLKFYPLGLLAIGVRERPRFLLMMVLASSLVMTVFILEFDNELNRIGANMAAGPFGGMFGARSLPLGFGQILNFLHYQRLVVVLLTSGMFVGVMAFYTSGVVSYCRDPDLRTALSRIDPTRRSFVLIGSVLTVECFFAHQNIDYRGIFLLLTVPGLLALVSVSPTKKLRWLYRITSVFVVMALWSGFFDRNFIGWLFVQLLWWWIVCIFSSIAFCLLEVSMRQQIVASRSMWMHIRLICRATPRSKVP